MFLTSHIEQSKFYRNFPRPRTRKTNKSSTETDMRENNTILFHHFCCCCSASSFVASVTSAAGWDWGFRFSGKIDFQAETSVTSSTKWRPTVRQVESPFIPSLSSRSCVFALIPPSPSAAAAAAQRWGKNQQHQQQKVFLAFASDCVYLCGSVEMNRVFFLLFFHLHSAAAGLLACESYIVNKTRKCSHKLLTFSRRPATLLTAAHCWTWFLLLPLCCRCCCSLLTLPSLDFFFFHSEFPLWTSFTLACLLVCVDFPIKFPSSSLTLLSVFVRILLTRVFVRAQQPKEIFAIFHLASSHDEQRS